MNPSVTTIVREILTPIIGGLAGLLAAHGLTLTPDQQAAAITLGATAFVTAERWLVRALTPKPLPPPSSPAPKP